MSGRTVFPLMFALLAAACSGRPSNSDTNIIGEKPRTMTTALNRNGEQMSKIAVFDKNVGRIHQFDTATLALLKSFPVKNPGEPHFVLYADKGDYLFDLSRKHLAIIGGAGWVQDDPIRFTGNPVSTIFRPDLGIAIVYDDRNSVGIMKLADDGKVVASWVGGALVSGDSTIHAGDMTEDGRLVLALGNNTIAIVNVAEAVANTKDASWPSSTILFTHAIEDMKWLAAVRGQKDLMMVVGSKQVALLDLASKSVVGTPVEIGGRGVEIYSKAVDAHVVLGGRPYTMVYPKGGALATRDVLPNGDKHLLRSTLDLEKQTWSFIDYDGLLEYSDVIEVQKSTRRRMMSRYDFSSMLNTDNRALPDTPFLELMKTSTFGFFLDSRLGHASVFAPESGADQEIRAFNLPYLSR